MQALSATIQSNPKSRSRQDSVTSLDPNSNLLPPVDHQNHPNVRFWQKQDWMESKPQVTAEANNKVGRQGKS